VLVHELAAANDLDRDTALRVLLFGLVDHTHPALAELSEDAVLADCLGQLDRGVPGS
jgi:hypothetical protein